MSKRLDRSELEARRIEAGKLLQRGARPAEVARRLSVSRTSVGRWQQTLTSGGQRSLRGAPSTGRPPLLDANDQKRLIAALKAGALAQGYSSDLWTLGRVGPLGSGVEAVQPACVAWAAAVIKDHILIQVAQVVERIGHLKNSRTCVRVLAR